MSLGPSSSLHHLHNWLRDGGACTLAEASQRLGVSKRHVRRLIQELRENDVPVQERPRGREKEFFLAPEEHHAPGLPSPFTEQQVLALVVAAQIARAKLNPTPLADPLQTAVEVLQTAYPDPALSFEADTEPNRWHFSDAPSVPIDPEIFWQLRKAAKDSHPVRIDYYSASSGRTSTDRKINPLLIAERRGSWLCVAYCRQRQTVLDFSMAAISAVRLCEDERFTPPASFDPSDYFEGRFGAVAGDTAHTVRLLVDPDRAPYFRRKVYHPSQHIEAERDDGRLVVTYTVQGLDEIGAWVRSWGAGVKVLAPDALITQVMEEAKAMQARYRDLKRTQNVRTRFRRFVPWA